MGGFSSRYFHDLGLFEDALTCEEPTVTSKPGTPVPSFKHRLLEYDPRSPSDEILRTPIEVACSRHRPILSSLMAQLDPRSPSLEISRTPIQVCSDGIISSNNSPPPSLNVSFGESDCDKQEETDRDKQAETDSDKEEDSAALSDSDQDISLTAAEEVATVTIETPALPTEAQPILPTEVETFIFADQDVEVESNKENTSIDSENTPILTPVVKQGENIKYDKENGNVHKKKLFQTPEGKMTPQPKVRTPLGAVSHNNSPRLMVRAKQRRAVNTTRAATPLSGGSRARITDL